MNVFLVRKCVHEHLSYLIICITMLRCKNQMLLPGRAHNTHNLSQQLWFGLGWIWPCAHPLFY
jgi:hypothetical protein